MVVSHYTEPQQKFVSLSTYCKNLLLSTVVQHNKNKILLVLHCLNWKDTFRKPIIYQMAGFPTIAYYELLLLKLSFLLKELTSSAAAKFLTGIKTVIFKENMGFAICRNLFLYLF